MRTSTPLGRLARRSIKFVSKSARVKRVQRWRQKKEELRLAQAWEIKLNEAKTKIKSINELRERVAHNLNKLSLKDLIAAEHSLAEYTIKYDEAIRTAGGNFGQAIDSLHQVRARIKDIKKQRKLV